MYDHLVWSVLLASAISPCIHGPTSSCCMATLVFVSTTTLQVFFLMGFRASYYRTLISLLNKSVAWLGNHIPNAISLTCNKVTIISLLSLKNSYGTLNKLYECLHLCIALVVVDEITTWSIFSCLENCLNQSDMKFMPVSDTIFVGSKIL